MQRLGTNLMGAGLLGVPVLFLSAQGLSFSRCVDLWMILAVGAMLFGVVRLRGFRNWWCLPLETEATVSPLVLAGVGLVFGAAGFCIVVFGKGASGPNAMTREQVILFGIVFLLIGMGAILLSLGLGRKRR